MRDSVEEVKTKTDLVALIGEHVKLARAGKHFKGLCPFHSEKTPSFIVSPELQIFKCFGCQKSGDCFSFLQDFEGMEFSEALKFLADRAGVKLERKFSAATSEKQVLYQINELAAKFYHYLLTSHPIGKKALDYAMGQRGLLRETINTFQVGFAPENQSALIDYLTKKKSFKFTDLVRAGVSVDVRGRQLDRFRGRLIFPLFDHRGNCVGLAGRILPAIEKALSRRGGIAKYINSPETLIYHKSSVLYGLNISRAFIKKQNYAVVVEGELDVLTPFQSGIKNIVAIKGSALTEEQIRILARLTSNIILALDSDLAGDQAARRGIAVAQKMGMTIKVANLGNFKDPDDAARTDPQGLKNSLKNAINIWDFLIESVFRKHKARSGEGKAVISREIIPLLAAIEDKIVQAHYAAVVGGKLNVQPETVLAQIETIDLLPRQTSKQPQEQATTSQELSRRELLERDLLFLGFSSRPEVLLQTKIADLIKGNGAKRLLQALESFMLKHSEFEVGEFASSLPDELRRGLSEVLLRPQTPEPGRALQDFAKSYLELVILETKLRQVDLTRKMIDQEKNKDKMGLRQTKLAYSQVVSDLSRLRSAAFDPAKELGL